MRYAIYVVSAVLGCTYIPPSTVTPEPRAPTTVAAPIDRTWVAAIDFFADRNIPIRTIDRLSGLIATESLRIGEQDSLTTSWADCGSTESGLLAPIAAVYNVRVRGDSLRSTVQITVRWASYYVDAMTPRNSGAVDCITLNKWEVDAEALIKLHAEKP